MPQPRACLVTGAASGIGQALVRRLLARGDRVLGVDLDPAGVPDGAERLRCDVASDSDVAAAVERAVTLFGRLDVLCNNAGIGSTTDVATCTVEEWDRVFAVNARGVFLGCHHGVPRMLAQEGGGVIVNTASVAGMIGLVDRAAYCASKGAVIALTRQVAVQYARHGIRCSCVCPGTVDSPWVGRLLAQSDDPGATRAALVARQPLGRLGTPDEVAAAIDWLASPDASFVTGEALVIDGGIAAG